MEYGVVYSPDGSRDFDLRVSANDRMRVERLGTNRLYYEWHKG